MPILPPNSVYPLDYDTDRTLFNVYNKTETTISADLQPWATAIYISPVGATEDEIWAENGFANISGELVYYDAVAKDGNDKINTLLNCVRNLGGNAPRFNESGTDIRGFVLAEHHNNLARSIVNAENFIGINLSENKETLDWRIRNLANQLEFSDDYGCPQVSFIYYVISIDPLLGTTISYDLEVSGLYVDFILEFGDGTFTTSDLSGTHIYPPNSTIDPQITVNAGVCQTVNSAVSRSQPNEPLVVVVPLGQTVTIDPIADFPDLQFITDPNTAADVNLPPIVFPCLDIGPFGPISIPSTIVLDPPVIVPSEVVFSNIPVIASTVSISPVVIDVSVDQFVELVCLPLGSGSGGATQSGGAVGGLNYGGYAIGGAVNNVAVGTADKIFYKTDAVSSLTSAALPTGSFRAGSSTTANTTHGYIAGGISSGYLNTIFRIAFSSEATSAFTTVNLSTTRAYSAGLSHGDTSGYFSGGLNGTTSTDKLAYSSSTLSTPTTLQLNPGRHFSCGVSNQYEKGYLAGGLSGGNAALSSTLLVQYSSDTFASKTTDDLKAARQRFASVDGNNSTGYLAGGNSNILSTVFSKSIEKMHYPSDSTVAMYTALAQARLNLGGLNEGSTKGYWLGGQTSTSTSSQIRTIETYHYINDTIYNIPNSLSQGRTNINCVSRVYINPSPAPTPTTTTFAATEEVSLPQLVTIGNGYVIPEEALQKSEVPKETPNDLTLVNNGYILPQEAISNEIPPTPTGGFDGTVKNALQDSFKTVKLVIKQDQVLPNLEELLGDE